MVLFSLTNSAGDTQGLDEANIAAIHNLGDIYYDDKGAKHVYVRAGASITAAGSVLTVDEDELEKEDADTGAATVNYMGKGYPLEAQLKDGSGGNWAETINARKGWQGVVNDGTEKGQAFEVEVNSATHLYLKDPLVTALTSGDNDIEVWSPWRVILVPTGGGANVKTVPLGITNFEIIDEYYFWMQVTGNAMVRVEGTTNTVGLQVGLSGVNHGAGICAIAGTDKDADDFTSVGVIIRGGDTDNARVWVRLRVGG